MIKDYIDANSWNEAKTLAIARVKNYFHQMATYWQDMKIGFTNWIMED